MSFILFTLHTIPTLHVIFAIYAVFFSGSFPCSASFPKPNISHNPMLFSKLHIIPLSLQLSKLFPMFHITRSLYDILKFQVIPAKAGIQYMSLFHTFSSFFYEETRRIKDFMFFIVTFDIFLFLDSRLRGNDEEKKPRNDERKKPRNDERKKPRNDERKKPRNDERKKRGNDHMNCGNGMKSKKDKRHGIWNYNKTKNGYIFG